MELIKGEHFCLHKGLPHLFLRGEVRAFRSRVMANLAASRVNGEAYRVAHRHFVIISEESYGDYLLTLERSVAEMTIDTLLEKGFELSVNDGEETTVKRSLDREAILKAMFTTDEDYLIAHRPREKKRAGYVRFIYGNSPSEVINDYTLSLEEDLERVDGYTDFLSELGL